MDLFVFILYVAYYLFPDDNSSNLLVGSLQSPKLQISLQLGNQPIHTKPHIKFFILKKTILQKKITWFFILIKFRNEG